MIESTVVFGKRYQAEVLRNDPSFQCYFCCYADLDQPKDGYITDSMWGCTVRNFQSLIVNWAGKNNLPLQETLNNSKMTYKSLFEENTIQVGDWSGPITLAMHLNAHSTFTQVSPKQPPTNFPCLVLFPMRLGHEEIEEKFLEPLVTTLDQPNSLGFIGGKRGESLYVIGKSSGKNNCTGEKLIYLDPHLYRASNSQVNFALPKWQPMLNLDVKEMEPTIVVAFNITSLEEYEQTQSFIENANLPVWENNTDPDLPEDVLEQLFDGILEMEDDNDDAFLLL